MYFADAVGNIDGLQISAVGKGKGADESSAFGKHRLNQLRTAAEGIFRDRDGAWPDYGFFYIGIGAEESVLPIGQAVLFPGTVFNGTSAESAEADLDCGDQGCCVQGRQGSEGRSQLIDLIHKNGTASAVLFFSAVPEKAHASMRFSCGGQTISVKPVHPQKAHIDISRRLFGKFILRKPVQPLKHLSEI